MKNLFAVKYYSTSTLLADKNTTPTLNPTPTTTLNPTLFENWTKEEVCSLLCSAKGKGGAGLTVEKAKSFYDAGFKGTSLANIVTHIQGKDVYFAVDKVKTNRDYQSISQTTLENVVNWVDNLLKTSLYHLWSADQVKQNLHSFGIDTTGLIPFNGTTLANIAQDLKQNIDEKHVIEKLEESFMKSDISFTPSTIKSIVLLVKNVLIKYETLEILLNDAFKDKTITTPEYLKQARTDPRYNYLRNLHDPSNLKKLEEMIGKNIPLPVLGNVESDYVPKDYDSKIPYLLTRQRFEVLKTIITREQGGYLLSGPYGVSKSYTMYLLAAYAFVNSIPLLYVPKCGKLVSEFQEGGKTKADNYLRSLLFYLNSDILSKHILSEVKNSAGVVLYCTNNIAIDQPVFYLFDEHNELFRKYGKGKMVINEIYFRGYSRWTADTASGNTMTIYCGSAHSSFEDRLPDGSETRIIRIVPPTEDEFKTLINDFGLDPQKTRKIDHVTGRIPTELKALAHFLKNNNISQITDSNLSDFMSAAKDKYNRRLNVLLEELKKSNKKKYFIEMLEQLFNLGFHNGRPTATLGIVYDQGLMYKDNSEKLFIINEPAKRVLFGYYCAVFNSTKTVISPNISSSEKGAQFRRYLLAKEFNQKHCATYNVVHTTPNFTQTLEYEVNVHMSLDLKRLSSLSHKNYLQNTTVLYIPESETFPAFDYPIISYKENTISIFLKQLTVSTVDSHYQSKKGDPTDIDTLMKRVYVVDKDGVSIRKKNLDMYSEDNKYSLLELIVHAVIGDFGIDEPVTNNQGKVLQEYIKRRKYDVNDMVIRNEVLVSPIKIDNFEINWYYIYESGSPSTDQSVKLVKEKGILYRNREEIEDKMKVYF